LLTPEKYVEIYKQVGSKNGVARHLGRDARSLRRFVKRNQARIDELLGNAPTVAEVKPKKEQVIDLHKAVLKLLNKNNKPIDELAKHLKISPRVLTAVIEDIKEQGYVVEAVGGIPILRKEVELESNVYKSNWNGDRILRFGLCGDNHSSSKYTQITHLHSFYDLLVSEGVTKVYHVGDIDEGEDMRQGHKYECYLQGADEHVAEIVKNYPSRPNITTEFITGNHDHSILKKVGHDIGRAIANERPDMKYLGQNCALISLTPNCTLELRHPSDGSAYSLSYKTQKMIDAMQGGEKPNILAVGHYHKAEYLFYRNIHTFQVGTFQAQTPWMKSKQISAHVGGWIVEIHVDDEGTITRCKGEFVPFYKMIKDDYLNWR